MTMKRIATTLIALMVAAACLTASAAAMTEAEAFKALEGMWEYEEYLVTFSYEDPEGTMDVLIEKDEADGTFSIWDYPACWYDETEGALICVGVERRRECVDPDTYETVELDWSLDDMQVAHFILSQDGETLVGKEIAGLESDLVLKRLRSGNKEKR